jgi:predicted transposase YdaD
MKDSPHDKLFKEAFGNPQNAAGEIRSVAPPALVAHMDFASLTAVPGSFRDVALADSSSDLLFSMRIGGRESLVYVLFEHKSATDRWVAFQLLRYPSPRAQRVRRPGAAVFARRAHPGALPFRLSLLGRPVP